MDLAGSDKEVLITAMNETQWTKAKKALVETIVIERVSVPPDVNISPDNADFQKFQQEKEEGKMLKIQLRNEMKSKVIELIGKKDSVKTAKSLTEAFIAVKRPKQPSGIATIKSR